MKIIPRVVTALSISLCTSLVIGLIFFLWQRIFNSTEEFSTEEFEKSLQKYRLELLLKEAEEIENKQKKVCS